MPPEGNGGRMAFHPDVVRSTTSTLQPVGAENPVRGSDQQSCPPGAPDVMIADHVPAVRVRHEALLFRMGVRDRPSPRRRSGGVKLGAA